MKTVIYILCLCLVSPVVIQATETADTILDSVAVTGLDSLLKDEIAGRLLSVKGGILNEGLVEHDVNTVKEYLREQGWWKAFVSASVDSFSGAPITLTFEVVPGEPVIFGLIDCNIVEQQTDDSKTVPADDVRFFVPPAGNELYGKQFSRQSLEGIVNNLISDFTGGGYPDVTAAPSLSARGDTVNIVLNITAGKRAFVDSVVIHGLSITKEYVIRRELTSLIGRPAGQDVVNDAGSLIRKLDFVRIKNPPSVEYDDKGNGILAIGLDEGSQGSFDGVLGYQPAEDGGSGEMLGKIDLNFANMFGTGRSAGIRWENLGRNTEDLELKYTEPWVFGFPYNVSLSFMQEERERRGYIKTAIAAGLGRYIGRLHVDGGFKYEKVSADTLHSSKAAGIELGAAWNSVDNPVNPSRGIRYGAFWSMVSKRYRFASGTETRLRRTEFDLDHYIPVRSRQTLAVLVRYRRVDIPLKNLGASDRYWLGGASSIRGYGESMFPAVKALWSAVEYRFLTGETSRVFVFADTGYLENREKFEGLFRKKTRTLIGYGFGLRLESRAGILGFDYGLGRGDSPGDGKLHVSMRTEF